MASELLPRPQGPLTDAAGHPLPEWYDFWRALAELLDSADAESIAGLQAAVAALQQAGVSLAITGPASVRVLGQSPEFVLTLDGDDPSPGANRYYGTAEGAKGWHARLLATLADVDMTDLADGDVLRWDATAELWVRLPVSGFAATLLEAADQSAALTTLGAQPAAASLTALSGALLPQAIDDAAAAAAGVPVGGFYANASAVLQRQT
jgi:hypothetical protein